MWQLRAPPNFSRPHLHASAATLSADDVPAFFIDSPDQAVHAITRQALLPGRTQTYMNAYAHGAIRSFIERRLAKKNSKATTSSKLEVLEKVSVVSATLSDLAPTLTLLSHIHRNSNELGRRAARQREYLWIHKFWERRESGFCEIYCEPLANDARLCHPTKDYCPPS